MLIYLLAVSIALNLWLLYLWRISRWYLSALVYHMHKRYGLSPDNIPKEIDDDYFEFRDGTTIWDRLFG